MCDLVIVRHRIIPKLPASMHQSVSYQRQSFRTHRTATKMHPHLHNRFGCVCGCAISNESADNVYVAVQ